jgi:antitoxin component of MazEF toxin-antitoxin module
MSSDTQYRRVQQTAEASLGVNLPKQYTDNIGIEKGDFVKVKQAGTSIIIERVDE